MNNPALSTLKEQYETLITTQCNSYCVVAPSHAITIKWTTSQKPETPSAELPIRAESGSSNTTSNEMLMKKSRKAIARCDAPHTRQVWSLSSSC